MNFRDRRQRLWRAAGLAVVLGGAAAACFWLFLVVEKQSGRPGWAAPFLAVAGFVAAVAAVAQVLLAWLQLRQGSRAESAGHLAPHERRDREARDRLRQHLGRRDRLPLMDEVLALDRGVHPAMPLPRPPGSGAAPSGETGTCPGRRRRRFVPGPRHGRPDKPRAPGQEQDLPTFVERRKGPEVRDWLRKCRDNGGFLVLVGDSSVGKTRLLYEAAREVLGDFAVLAPDPGDGALVNTIAAASFPLPKKLIVWLDELQRFLDGPYFTTPEFGPITCATVRRLLDGPTPVIIVGTLWRDHAEHLRKTVPGPATGKKQPRHPGAWDVLNDHRLHEVSLRTFCTGEREDAELLRAQDPRLAEALADPYYGVTEVLAGAPELMRRYEQATKEQEAVLNAAIDARRVGIQGILSEELLCEAARGYLPAVCADDTWSHEAMDDLISLSRAAAPLVRVPSADPRRRGVTVADYLLQHLTHQRRSTRLSAVTWLALIDHTRRHDDLVRLGGAAHNRLLYSCAESIYRRLTADGDKHAARKLADLLARQGRADELLALANAGNEHAAHWRDSLADLLAGQGRAAEASELLRLRPKADHKWAAELLADLLAGQGRADELWVRRRRQAAPRWVLLWLADLLAGQGRDDDAIKVLRHRAYADDSRVLRYLPELLAGQGRALELVRPVLDPDAWDAAKLLAEELPELLAGQGRAAEAIKVLRLRFEAGDWWAAEQLAELLAGQGRAAEAIKVLWTEVHAGTPTAAEHLITMLAEQGKTASAARMRRFGLNPDDSIADEDSGNQQSQPTTAP